MEHTIQVHAHDVLNLVDENPGAFDTATLPVKVREVFGMEASFYACSAADMTAEELLVFLFARQKLVEIDGRIHLNRANICQH